MIGFNILLEGNLLERWNSGTYKKIFWRDICEFQQHFWEDSGFKRLTTWVTSQRSHAAVLLPLSLFGFSRYLLILCRSKQGNLHILNLREGGGALKWQRYLYHRRRIFSLCPPPLVQKKCPSLKTNSAVFGWTISNQPLGQKRSQTSAFLSC